MRQRIESVVSFWIARPLACLLFWLWRALKHGWLGAAWCVRRARERWARSAKVEMSIVASKRVDRRQAA